MTINVLFDQIIEDAGADLKPYSLVNSSISCSDGKEKNHSRIDINKYPAHPLDDSLMQKLLTITNDLDKLYDVMKINRKSWYKALDSDCS